MKKLSVWRSVIFVAILVLIPILTLVFASERPFLISENRMAASLKKPDIASVLDGSTAKNFETYFNDRIIGRESILIGKAYLDMHLLKKPRIMDVAFAKDRDLLLDEVSLSEVTEQSSNLADEIAYLQRVNEYARQNGAVMVNLAFTRQSVAFAERYPTCMLNAHQPDQLVREVALELISQTDMRFFDFYEDFRNDPDRYYYKSDHHPNFNATMHAYDKILDVAAEENMPLTDIRQLADFKENDLAFIGSLNRRMFNLFDAQEHLPYYELKQPIPYERTDNGVRVERPIFRLDDPYYTMYMGGNIGMTEIDTKRPDLPTVLVVGDSTTNLLEALLWPSANKMVSISFTFYDKENIFQVIDRIRPDLIVFSFLNRTYSNNFYRIRAIVG